MQLLTVSAHRKEVEVIKKKKKKKFLFWYKKLIWHFSVFQSKEWIGRMVEEVRKYLNGRASNTF